MGCRTHLPGHVQGVLVAPASAWRIAPSPGRRSARAPQLLRREVRAVRDHHHPALAVPDPDPAAVRWIETRWPPRRCSPARAARRDRVAPVGHRLRLRFGDATDPESRWSFDDDQRTVIPPRRTSSLKASPAFAPLAVAQPADPGGEPLEGHLRPGHLDPASRSSASSGKRRSSAGGCRRGRQRGRPSGTGRGPRRNCGRDEEGRKTAIEGVGHVTSLLGLGPDAFIAVVDDGAALPGEHGRTWAAIPSITRPSYTAGLRHRSGMGGVISGGT